MSWYQKGNLTNLEFTGAIDSEWQWHQLDHTQVCTRTRQTTTPAPNHLISFTSRMSFLPPEQQCQSTEGSEMENELNTVPANGGYTLRLFINKDSGQNRNTRHT